MADEFLYLTTTGRTTGQPRQIEIWFVAVGGCFYMVSEKREASGWVQNIAKNPGVRFSVGTRGAQGSVRAEGAATARALDDAAEPELCARVRAAMDAKYKWSEGLVVEVHPKG